MEAAIEAVVVVVVVVVVEVGSPCLLRITYPSGSFEVLLLCAVAS